MLTIKTIRTRSQRQSANPPYGLFWYYPHSFVLSMLVIARTGGYKAGRAIITGLCRPRAAQAIAQYLRLAFPKKAIVEGLWTNADTALILRAPAEAVRRSGDAAAAKAATTALWGIRRRALGPAIGLGDE